MTDHVLLSRELEGLLGDVPYVFPCLANAASLLYYSLEDINWAGFYLARNGILVLGPFQGRPACTEIAFGRGVCGTAFAADSVQLVPDVHAFPGHIACDSASRSEIVLPLHIGGRLLGVLDIDSPVKARFSEYDKKGLVIFADVLEAHLEQYCSADISIMGAAGCLM